MTAGKGSSRLRVLLILCVVQTTKVLRVSKDPEILKMEEIEVPTLRIWTIFSHLRSVMSQITMDQVVIARVEAVEAATTINPLHLLVRFSPVVAVEVLPHQAAEAATTRTRAIKVATIESEIP
jgi:hypothetical protein